MMLTDFPGKMILMSTCYTLRVMRYVFRIMHTMEVTCHSLLITVRAGGC